MDSPKSADSFFGIDLQTADPRLSGTFVDCSGGSLTPEVFEAAYQSIVNAPPPIPCGLKGNPHLVRPAPVGEITYCIQCGYCCTQAEDKTYRDLNEQENELMYQAFKSLMEKSRRQRRKKRSL
jgi:hypothetical protein